MKTKDINSLIETAMRNSMPNHRISSIIVEEIPYQTKEVIEMESIEGNYTKIIDTIKIRSKLTIEIVSR